MPEPQPPAAPATAANPAPREPAGAVNAAVPLAPRPTIDTGPLMTRGQALLGQGDVAGARLFFERAAEQGDGAAMMALGRTYDPIELRRLGVLGLKSDANRAMQWYRSAATAGDANAQQSIGRLSEWIERTR
jgi:TPR repeat protein